MISSFGYISWPKMAQGTPKKFEKMNKLSSHKKIKKLKSLKNEKDKNNNK